MTQENKPSQTRKLVQTAALLLLLVGLPLGSWFYLQQGLDYRLTAFAELEDFGKIPPFELRAADDSLLTRADLRKRMVVAAFLTNEQEELRQSFGSVLSRLLEQFDERDDLALVVHGLGDIADTPAAMQRFADDFGLKDENQCYFLPGGQPEIEQLALEGYQLPLEAGSSLTANPYLVLADTSLTIRRYYDVRQEAEVKKLVEHIAILLPRTPEKDIVFRREKEK